MYEQECEKLVHMQNEVKAALEKEEALHKLADDQKAKVIRALKKVKVAKDLLAEESFGRHVAEIKALKESLAKQKIINELLSSDIRCRRFMRDEIEMATDFFSERFIIGEGAYGKVYKCQFNHSPVAVKVLRADASDKKEEFLREVEVLSQLHPSPSHTVAARGVSRKWLSGIRIHGKWKLGGLYFSSVQQVISYSDSEIPNNL